MSEWSFKTARALRKALRAKKVSALELARDAIASIEQHDAKVNAMCVREFDALICPIMPTPAFVQDHSPDQTQRRISVDGKDYPYQDQLFWPGVATCPGLPATSIPLGLAGGLPVGAQIVGPWLEDRTTLRLAELIEQDFGGFIAPRLNAL